MKINGFDPIPGADPLKETNRIERNNNSADKASKGMTQADKVEVSSKSAEMLKYAKIAQELPDVRMDRVEKLAEIIKSGQYNIRAEKIAQAIIKGNFIDKEI